jgi:hypothetical protein
MNPPTSVRVKMLTNEQIEDIIKFAFSPFEGRVEIYDYEDKLMFKILETNGTIISREYRSPISLLRDPRNLNVLIHKARVALMTRGLELDPWSFPDEDTLEP